MVDRHSTKHTLSPDFNKNISSMYEQIFAKVKDKTNHTEMLL